MVHGGLLEKMDVENKEMCMRPPTFYTPVLQTFDRESGLDLMFLFILSTYSRFEFKRTLRHPLSINPKRSWPPADDGAVQRASERGKAFAY